MIVQCCGIAESHSRLPNENGNGGKFIYLRSISIKSKTREREEMWAHIAHVHTDKFVWEAKAMALINCRSIYVLDRVRISCSCIGVSFIFYSFIESAILTSLHSVWCGYYCRDVLVLYLCTGIFVCARRFMIGLKTGDDKQWTIKICLKNKTREKFNAPFQVYRVFRVRWNRNDFSVAVNGGCVPFKWKFVVIDSLCDFAATTHRRAHKIAHDTLLLLDRQPRRRPPQKQTKAKKKKDRKL